MRETQATRKDAGWPGPLDLPMRSLHIPITWEEWERMPWRFGWKREYSDGHAHLTPRRDHVHVFVRPPIDPDVHRGGRGRGGVLRLAGGEGPRTRPTQHRGLLRRAARQAVVGSLTSDTRGRGANHRRGIVERTGCRTDAGAADGTPGPPPAWDRQHARRDGSTGPALAGRERPPQRLPRIEQGEHPWHQAFGFEEELDLYFARLRRMFYAHDASRHERLQTPEARREHARLEALFKLWSHHTEELEKVAECERLEAVTPALRYSS